MARFGVVIVGAGFGGIAAAIQLRSHGFEAVTILDRAPEPGGTWYYNTYPGSACDVPSHLYSFSFAQRSDWSRVCSPQREILDYLRGVANQFAVDDLLIPNTEVVSCIWNREARRWAVTSADGRNWEADAVVLATGQLHRPAYPPINGRELFSGRSFHSSCWDHEFDLSGKRVAVIGTGASAVQFVPEIASEVERLVVFQRTANWFLPRKNRHFPAWVMRVMRLGIIRKLVRYLLFYLLETLTLMIRHPRTWGRVGQAVSSAFMRRQLRDPELRRKVWPDYTFGCKRILFSSLFLRTLQRENVEVVTESILRITEGGIVTVDGVEREVDCIIYGTGFQATEFMFPMEVVGMGGHTLREVWAGGAHAHLGVMVPGFPSLFLMYGPNTNTSGGSIILYLEAQAEYLCRALDYVRCIDAAAIDVQASVDAASDREVQARFAGTAWADCDSWYRNRGGRHIANWPGYMHEYVGSTSAFDPGEYNVIPRPTGGLGVG